ncbi:MAG TPA: DNA-formamidopyrimidine glycosylase family protein [Acidimicrobiales bacterium]
MPELPEVEAYRRIGSRALGRPIVGVHAPDAWFLKGGLSAAGLSEAMVGRALVAVRRVGKVLLFDTSGPGPVLGLRFGMTGRLLVDGAAGVDRLLHSSRREEERWDRCRLRFDDGGDLRIRDPRRLGGVSLDPREDLLGPDAAAITPAQLRAALAGSRVALKARLLDQRRVAGVGNLMADETLWRSALSPLRPAGGLTTAEHRRLHRHLRSTVADLIERGGSHLGDLIPHRVPGGRCPRDGAELRSDTVGGRATWWCPRHQR